MALSNRSADTTDAGVSVNLKEMHQAYEIRAALEEVGGRAAAQVLKGNTATLRRELDAMRTAFDRLDLDSFVEHDIAFHRNILQASQNEVLLLVWDSLAVDLRIRGVIGMISQDFPELVESHSPIVDALEKGLGREAGLLLRNHVETVVEFLKKLESESEFNRVLRKDLENAKEVHRAFFPRTPPPSIPAWLAKPFIGPPGTSEATTMIFFLCRPTTGESRLEMSVARESGLLSSWPASRRRFGRKLCTPIRIFPPLSPTLTGWFSPLPQNISTHRCFTQNMTLRRAHCDTSTPVTIRRWCFDGEIADARYSTWNPVGRRLGSWRVLNSLPDPFNSKKEMSLLPVQMESLSRKTFAANCGGRIGSKACCELAVTADRRKSSAAFWMTSCTSPRTVPKKTT